VIRSSGQQRVISRALAAPVAELEPVVQKVPVCNIDETRWRQRDAQVVDGGHRPGDRVSHCARAQVESRDAAEYSPRSHG
jgi:hypothetical protein